MQKNKINVTSIIGSNRTFAVGLILNAVTVPLWGETGSRVVESIALGGLALGSAHLLVWGAKDAATKFESRDPYKRYLIRDKQTYIALRSLLRSTGWLGVMVTADVILMQLGRH